MSQPDFRPRLRPRLRRQRGHAAVEFALIATFLFSFIFGTIETARIIYIWSTMTQVTSQTARGAALTSPKETLAWAAMRQRAMFLSPSAETLPLAGDIGPGHLRIDYLKADATPATAPLCRAQNVVNCLNAPNGNNCARFVRVRLCDPAVTDSCTSVKYEPLVNLSKLDVLKVSMPPFTAIAPLETMGAPDDCL